MSLIVNLPSPSSFDNFEREQDLEALTISEGSSSPLYEEAFFTSENACGMSEAHLLEEFEDSDLEECKEGLLKNGIPKEKQTWVYLVMLTISLGGQVDFFLNLGYSC